MKCFLVNPNYPKRHRLLLPVPPLGLALIAAVFEHKGVEVRVEDQFASNISNELLIEKILAFKTDIVGIGCLTPSFGHTEDMIRSLRGKGFKGIIIMGNVHPTVFPEEILKSNACDVIIHGEGEKTTEEFISAIQNKTSWSDVPGISFKNAEGEIFHTPKRPQIENLDDLPLPAWHLFDLSYYTSAPMLQIYQLALPVQSSRGCPERCIFCGQEIFYPKMRFRSLHHLMHEIDILVDQYHISYFIFADANFPVTKKYGLEFCERFRKKPYFGKVQWGTELKPNIVDEELLQTMKESGCYLIEYGFEVGDEKILKTLNKKTSLEDGKRAMRLTRKAKIQSLGLFMIGLPGEGYKEIFKTFFFAMKLGCDMAKFNIAIPLPGSKLFELHKTELMKNFHPESYSSWYRPDKNDPPLTTIPGCLSSRQLLLLQSIGMLMFYGRPWFILTRLYQRTLSLKDIFKGGFFVLYEFFKSVRFLPIKKV